MSYEKSVTDHYAHGDLLGAIKARLPDLGKTLDDITTDDLAPVDEFHIGGRLATDHLVDQLGFAEQYQVLDVGCGLGGAARYVANKYRTEVTGIDLTAEYIETGNVLSSWLKLDQQVRLKQGSALSMPFDDNTFDGGYMLHVGMNIEDKAALFAEVFRVLRPGSSLGVYDVMRQNEGDMHYPLPWATDCSTSRLSTPDQYRQALNAAGFSVLNENIRHQFALDFYARLRANKEANVEPPPLSLHTLMKQSAGIKIKNLVHNLKSNTIAPVEIIAKKPVV